MNLITEASTSDELTPSVTITRRPSRNHWLEGLATLVLAISAFMVYSLRGPYNLDVSLLFVVYALLALGMYVPVFLGGHLDIAYNAYFAIGAYSVAIMANQTSWPILWSIPLAVIIASSAAILLGFATRKLSGFHLALAALVFGGAAYRWIVSTPDVTGGPAGLGSIPRPQVFGLTLGREAIIAAGILTVWATALAVSRFRGNLAGLALRLQREAPEAAESCGIPTRALQVISLATGAGIASLAGVMLALMNQFVLAESFTIAIVFVVLFIPIVGGVGSPWGAVLGAIVITIITEGGSFFDGPGSLIFGLATLGIMLLIPGGLLASAGSAYRWSRGLGSRDRV